jgi:hypothetical protein
MTRSTTDSERKKNGNRATRLAKALRENLRRRKAQERARTAPPATDKPEKPRPVPGNNPGR